jgi:hypothetical protein
MNVFFAVSKRRVFSPFFFAERNVTVQIYLEMLQNWLTARLAEEDMFIFQKDGAPSQWPMGVREYRTRNLTI